jgi:anaerobic selenocysteine-containing dehydrogenase
MTAPDIAKRLAAIRARGGKIVLIDPRRTETADVASEHHFIRPATDAAFLMALLNTLRAEGLMRIAQPERLRGLDDALNAIAHITPEVAAGITGIDADTIRRIARELAAAPSAAIYGRVGTSLQAFGTLNQWLIQLLNLVTGNLDRAGGVLPTQPLIPILRRGAHARWRSRVRGLPESGGELPVAVLAEEIETPGKGQIRGMITVCGNPVLSTPDGRRLDDALASLDFMIAIDIYRNETTRHADLILPPASSLQHDHYDFIFNALAIRNVARYNEAIWPRGEDERYDWEIIGALTEALAAQLGRETKRAQSTAQHVEAALSRTRISMDTLRAAEHGLDLGALEPSLFDRLETPDRKVDCAPQALLADIARFTNAIATREEGAFLLIGRRHLRSNNSWMHGSHRLIKGARRDQLLMHPDDLASLDIADGQTVEIRARSGAVRTIVQASDTVMRGVVSLPHGFGHNRPGTRLGLAEENAGVSYNDVTDAAAIDEVSGNAALNGVRVRVVGV